MSPFTLSPEIISRDLQADGGSITPLHDRYNDKIIGYRALLDNGMNKTWPTLEAARSWIIFMLRADLGRIGEWH